MNRMHAADPIIFSKGFVMRWQNGYYASGPYAPRETDLRAALWVYEWSAADNGAELKGGDESSASGTI